MRQARPVTPHSILSQHIADLHDTMQTEGADANWLNALQQCRNLAEPLEDYLLETSTTASPALAQLETATRELDWDQAYEDGKTDVRLEQEMVSGELEGQFLKMLVAISGAKRILEIGSFTGYASLAMAEALPADGQLVACERDPFTANFARQQLAGKPEADKITIRVGDAADSLRQLAEAGERFDLVFIDADKQGYLPYFNTLMDHNVVAPGGLICVDNTLYQGQVYASEIPTENALALAHFNKTVNDDPRVEQVVLPLRDGLTLIRRVR